METTDRERDRETRLYRALNLLSIDGFLDKIVYDRLKAIDLNIDFE